MPRSPSPRFDADRYRSLGLIGDPFLLPSDERQPEPIGVRLLTRAEALRFLAAIDASASEARSRPILVLKSQNVPVMYNVLSETEVLRVSAGVTGVLPVYVPLDLMSVGRIRAALGAVGEHLAEDTFDLTLAAYVRRVLTEPDPALPEFGPIADEDLAALADRLGEQPRETLAEYFGPCEDERGDTDDLELMMRVSVERQSRLEAEPKEEEASPEESTGDDADDALATVFVAPVLGTTADEEASSETVDEEKLARELLVDYVIAHTRTHLSPVVARGLIAYRARGMSAMSQEFKITKAPRKTLRALMRFACHRYRKVALLYDGLEQWERMSDEHRARVAGTFTELRIASGEFGMLAISVIAGAAPEVEEQFVGGRHVDWSMPGLAQMMEFVPVFDETLVRGWVAAAATEEAGPGKANQTAERLLELRSHAEDDLERFAAAAAVAVESAADRGADSVDDVALAAAMSTIGRQRD